MSIIVFNSDFLYILKIFIIKFSQQFLSYARVDVLKMAPVKTVPL